ncbi:taurine transport system permease protein [Variovorax sp. PDC80]|uniref:ABC transporter permease n=1 Tax=Variovorax sp. PDC80 TaxID=1882827 RepID=UPI0008ED9A0D|nr:ABC transporter permease [Variovorax sp. PDC80]SFQ09654.1 taurine transport system permease protein [Variovorax sp. PDC80]
MSAAPNRPNGARGRARWINLGSFAALFVLWLLITVPIVGDQPLVAPLFLPSPMSVWNTFLQLMQNGYQGKTLAHHLGISLFRFGVAFGLTVLVAVPLGLWMGMNETVKAVLDPPIEITRPMPKLALLPLLIIWFGIGEVSKIVIIVLALFPILSISAMQAVRAVGRRKVQAAMALGASRTMIFRRVIFPASLPGIFTGIRVSIGLGVTMLVGAEMIATNAGIAYMAMSASDFLLTNVVIVGALIMAILGYLLDLLARALENKVVHWGGKEG